MLSAVLLVYIIVNIHVNAGENTVDPDWTALVMICSVVSRYTYVPFLFQMLSKILARILRIQSRLPGHDLRCC